MSSRDIVLDRIRTALGGSSQARTASATAIPRDYRAATGHLGTDELADRFTERVDEYRATVTGTTRDDLPHHLAELLTAHQHRSIAAPAGLDDRWLSCLPATIEIRRDPPTIPTTELDRIDAVVTAAALGIAETGTIVLDGSPDQGRRALSLVPDHHLCVVLADQIVTNVPDAIARLVPTRPQTWISGPSATSDIELDRVEGVHGPRTLNVIIVEVPQAKLVTGRDEL